MCKVEPSVYRGGPTSERGDSLTMSVVVRHIEATRYPTGEYPEVGHRVANLDGGSHYAGLIGTVTDVQEWDDHLLVASVVGEEDGRLRYFVVGVLGRIVVDRGLS